MTANNSTKITLTEEDISGASLRGKIPSALTIPELKRWLSCRKGAKLSGTKRTLVERVQSYIDGGLDKDLVDPDKGENIARKRRNLGINADDAAAVNDEFMFPPPTALWKGIADGRTILPEFTLANMMNYFVTRKVCDGEIAGDFKHVNNHSYPLFKAGHIQRIRLIKGNDSNVYLSAVCLPEMRKDREYKIQVVLSPSAEILYAEDGCPAGKGPAGSCKHIAAFCYAIEEFVRLGFTRPFLSCTSRLQAWNQPRKKKLEPKTIYEISFERAEYGKMKKSHPKPIPRDYNAIPMKHRRDQLEATKKLSELCSGLSRPCAFLKVLNTTPRGTSSVEEAPLTALSNAASLVNISPSSVTATTTSISPPNAVSSLHTSPGATYPTPCASPLTPGATSSGTPDSTASIVTSASQHAPAHNDLHPRRLHWLPPTPPPPPPGRGTTPPLTANGFNNPWPLMSEPVEWTTPSQLVTPPTASCSSSTDMPIKLPLNDATVGEIEIPHDLSEEAKFLFNNKVKVNAEQAAVIESSTRDQSENNEWFKHRQCRLTASNFGAVVKRKKQDCSKLVERLTTSNQNLNVSSLNYGCNNEDIVANYYVQYQERHGHPGIKVFPCGLVVNPKYSWLGASPDRVVYDPTSDPPYGGLEIKCIESGKGMTPLQTYQAKREPQCGKKKSFCLLKIGEILELDPNHHYHQQVQGQCGVSGLRWNDFVLMTDLTLGDQGVHVERIYFDEKWHETSLPKLTDFYFTHIMPVLLRQS